jgi:hypothetical protein
MDRLVHYTLPNQEADVLPFHKRSRVNSSIEIGTDELEAIELPRARPPSVRPSYIARPSISFAHNDDDEMTVIRMDKRPSSSPPPSSRSMQMPRIPRSSPPPVFERPRYDHEDVTMLHPSSSSRPLLAMSAHHEVPPPPSSRLLDDAPRSSFAVDAGSSAQRAVDLSMTSSSSGSTDLSQLRRPTMGWAAGLVVAGVFAGIIGAFVARGEGLAAAASLVDPSSHAVTADVSHALGAQPQTVQAQPQAQAPVAIAAGAAAPQVASPKPAAPSCNADAAPVVAKVETKEVAPKVVEKIVVAAPVQHVAYVAPVRHEVREAPVAPVAPVARARASSRHGDDMESASAADALAKAQLDAALSR